MELDWEADRLEGRWWAPDLPSKLVGGSLVRNQEGIRELHLFGWPGEWNGRRDLQHLPNVLHGLVDGKAVTLFGCRPASGRVSGNDEPSRVLVAMVLGLGGRHIAAETHALFDSATVRIDYLNEWADRRAFSFTAEHPDKHGDGPGVVYTQHEPLVGSLPAAKVRLERVYSSNLRDEGVSSATMISNERLVFEFDAPLAVDAIEHDYVRPVANMLSLASRRPCPTLELTVGAGRPWFVDGAVVLRNRNGSSGSQRRRASPLLFRCQILSFDKTMARWFELHEQLGIVCDLLASLREPGNLANHFLNIASALESDHRRIFGKDKPSAAHKSRLKRIYGAVEKEDLEWLKSTLAFSYQPSYLSRLQELLEAASAHFESKIGNSDRWATWLKNGRNSIAHRGPKMVDIEKEWRATYAMTRSAEWLLVVLLLQDLGLPRDHIKWALGRQQSWGFMTDDLRYAVPDLFA